MNQIKSQASTFFFFQIKYTFLDKRLGSRYFIVIVEMFLIE